MNHRTLFKIGFIVFAFSLFSGLVTITSPSSFPWKSALAQIDGNETSTGEEPEPPTNGNGEEPEPPTNGNGDDDASDGGGTSCHPSYPDVCIPPPPPNLNCDDVDATNFEVLPPDPHDLDGNDNDGLGCESGSNTPDEPEPPTNGNDTNGNGEEPPPTNGNQTNGNQTNGNVTTPRDELEVRIGDVILQPECAAEHWNKIVFRITTDPTGIVPSNMINTELEVIERVNHIGLLNVKDIVRASIVNEPGVLLPQLTFEEADQLEIEILDVEYGLACLP